MKSLFSLSVVVLLLCFIACSPSMQVTSDYDKNVNMSQYKTFAIDTFQQSQKISELNTNRIINAIKSNLTSKGFTEDKSNPDMLVHIAAILQDKKAVTSNTNYGYGGFYRPYMWAGGVTGYTTYDVQNYKDGSLIIDVVDSKTMKLFWEGIGNNEIDKPLDKPDEQIPTSVNSILKSFPPGQTASK